MVSKFLNIFNNKNNSNNEKNRNNSDENYNQKNQNHTSSEEIFDNKKKNFSFKKNFLSKNNYYEPEDVTEIKPLTTNSNKECSKLKKENAILKAEFEKQMLEKFKSRRSIRKFSPKKLDEKVVFDIIEGGLNAPCAGNLQNSFIIVVNDKEKINTISQIALQQAWISDAPTLLIVVRDNSFVEKMYPHDGSRYSIQNTAAVIENILMMAHCYGLGACWVEACENEVLCEYLSIPTGREVDAIIPIGYPLENPHIVKDPISSHVYFEKHGNKKGNLVDFE